LGFNSSGFLRSSDTWDFGFSGFLRYSDLIAQKFLEIFRLDISGGFLRSSDLRTQVVKLLEILRLGTSASWV
jgi:hypothetical protein